MLNLHLFVTRFVSVVVVNYYYIVKQFSVHWSYAKIPGIKLTL